MNRLRSYLHPDSKILEIGSGNGGILEVFKTAGFTNLFGVEPNIKEAEYCNTILGINTFEGVFEDYNEGGFDLILVGGTIDHIRDPAEFLGSIRKKLNTDGIFYVDAHDSVAQLVDSDIFFKIDHCFYYSPISLDMLLAISGLRVMSFEKYSDYENVVDFAHSARVSWKRQFKPHFNFIAKAEQIQDIKKIVFSRFDFINLDLRIIRKHRLVYLLFYAVKKLWVRINY